MDANTFPTTSSALWNAAWGGRPIGPIWNHDDTNCVMCGARVVRGSNAAPAGPRLFDKGFNFKIEAKFKGEAACGDCASLWHNFWMQKGSKSYAVLGKGVFWLSKNTDIAAFVLSPPEAPYVAIFNTRQQAQVIWRTPVALPSHVLQVRIDDEVLHIDTVRVREALKAWKLACEILVQVGRPKGQPYLLSYNLASSATGMKHPVNADAVEKHSQEGAAAIALLSKLTMGEWWALSACREVDLNAAPERRAITEEDTKKKPKDDAAEADEDADAAAEAGQ
jgi:CRISPR type IV-associated protein Csf1